METIITSNINVVRRGLLIGSVAKLGSGSCGVLVGRNLSQILTLLIATIGVVGILEMVFTNPIMTIHVNMIVDRPLMSSMAVG